MTFVAKRLRFRNGERHSVLAVPGGLPVHEVTVFLARFRKRGRAANTIHGVCRTLALLYRELTKAKVDVLARLRQGEFLTIPELNSLAEAAQYWAIDLDDDDQVQEQSSNVVDIRRIGLKRKSQPSQRKAVDTGTAATRMRYIAQYLEFLSGYFGAALPVQRRKALQSETTYALETFRAQIPKGSRRAKLGAREGLSREDQDRVLAVVHPDSPNNPWQRGFVRQRNWVIVVLLLATGMRRGELLGIQLGDLNPNQPKISILRRADAKVDPRRIQPNTKTNDREVEVRPAIMRVVLNHKDARHEIKAARKHPLLIVNDDGEPLSLGSVDKIFMQLREACPGLPVRLTSHVLRHTWNERFSEEADEMKLSEASEQRARNEQQGWADNSKMAATYTRRHASRKGREVALKLQEKLDVAEK